MAWATEIKGRRPTGSLPAENSVNWAGGCSERGWAFLCSSCGSECNRFAACPTPSQGQPPPSTLTGQAGGSGPAFLGCSQVPEAEKGSSRPHRHLRGAGSGCSEFSWLPQAHRRAKEGLLCQIFSGIHVSQQPGAEIPKSL